MGFVPIDSDFTITETSSQLRKFTMSDFEFFHFFVFFFDIQTVSYVVSNFSTCFA